LFSHSISIGLSDWLVKPKISNQDIEKTYIFGQFFLD